MKFKGESYPVGQSKWSSFLETILGTGWGFIVALLLNKYALPLFGLQPSWGAATGITLIFTFASLINRYFMRRVFNWWHVRQLRAMQQRWSRESTEETVKNKGYPGDIVTPPIAPAPYARAGDPCVCGAYSICSGQCPYEGYRPGITHPGA